MSAWAKSLWKDSIVYGLGYGVSRLLQIIILPIIAHSLTISEFGYYSNYVIFYTIAGGFFVFGLDSAVARYFYDTEDRKYHQQLFSSAIYFILFFSLVSIVLLYYFPEALLHLLNIPPNYSQILNYVLLVVPAVTLNNFLLSWFKWKRQKIFFLINSGGSVLFLLIPLLLTTDVSFSFIFKVILWSQFALALISIVLALPYLRLSFNVRLMGSLLRYGFPWMLVFIFGISRTYLDRFFLTQYLSDETYGLYNFTVRIATLISLVITAFDMSFGPLAFSIWNKEGAPVFFARLQSLYTFLISSIACAITITSPLIIKLLGGEKYAGAEKILPILLFAAIPLSLINFSNLGTAHAKKSFLSTMSLFCGFIVVLLLNILLTKHFLQYGATMASLLGHLVIIITGYFFSHKYYKIPFRFGQDAALFLGFFLLSFASIYLTLSSSIYLNIALQLGTLGIVVYFLFIYLFPEHHQKLVAFIKRNKYNIQK